MAIALISCLVPLVPSLAVAPAASTAAASAELRGLLVAAAASRSTPDAARANALVAELAAARVPFDAALLGATDAVPSGLWRASYTAGAPPPRWKRNAERLAFFRNRAGQAYDATTGRVANYGEVAGPSVYFTACGSFRERDASVARCPKDYDVAIEEGGFVVFGKRFISSAISGPGFLRVLYADEDLRIFESPTDSPDTGEDRLDSGVWESAGLRVVQVREAVFEESE